MENHNFILSLAQIAHMIAFIEQEASEKVEEIECKVKKHVYVGFPAMWIVP